MASTSTAPARLAGCTVGRWRCWGTSRRGSRRRPAPTTAGDVLPSDSIDTATTTVGCKACCYPRPWVDTVIRSPKIRDGQEFLIEAAGRLVDRVDLHRPDADVFGEVAGPTQGVDQQEGAEPPTLGR